MFEPLETKTGTSSSRMIFGNSNSNVAIVSLWTRAKEVAEKIGGNDYLVIGQLFSAERGLDLLLRNLLANPQITNIVITGVDFSRSGAVLRDFFEKGFERGETEMTKKPVWRVKSSYTSYLDLDIPEDSLNILRETINVSWIPNIREYDSAKLIRPEKKREKILIEKKENKPENTFVGEETVYTVRGGTVEEVWLKALNTIMKFGKYNETKIQYQKEILNLVSVISVEDPDKLSIPEFLPFDETHIKNYINQITSDTPLSGASYTYGNRIRKWFGLDQVDAAVDKLKRSPISKSVVINIWDPNNDAGKTGTPCINHIWLRIRDNKLYMTATIRSNDIFESYPENAYGLRALQNLIRKRISDKLELGDLVINSESAHIYEDAWGKAKEIVGRYLFKYISGQANPALNQDPRGNFVINIVDKEIIVEHLSTENEIIGEYRGKKAYDLVDKLSKAGVFSVIGHALDIGHELAKAEIAMRLGIDYLQNQSLDLSQVKT